MEQKKPRFFAQLREKNKSVSRDENADQNV